MRNPGDGYQTASPLLLQETTDCFEDAEEQFQPLQIFSKR